MDRRRGRHGRHCRAREPAGRRAAGAVSPYPLLPEAMPFLLLPRLHGQERARGRTVPGSPGPGVGAVPAEAGHCRQAARLRVLRGRHAVVPVDAPVAVTRRKAHGKDAVDRCRGNHVRVRAGHADRIEAAGDPGDGRLAPEPRRRELRRSHPRAERPRPSIARDRADLRSGQSSWLPADQHRLDRRHARRDGRQLGGVRAPDARPRAR